jgi:hypothetical protein
VGFNDPNHPVHHEGVTQPAPEFRQ